MILAQKVSDLGPTSSLFEVNESVVGQIHCQRPFDDSKRQDGASALWSPAHRDAAAQPSDVAAIAPAIAKLFRKLAHHVEAEIADRSALHRLIEVGRRFGRWIEWLAVVGELDRQAIAFQLECNFGDHGESGQLAGRINQLAWAAGE